MDVRNINVLVLAYLGDTIYERYVREYLIKKGINNVKTLQSLATNYVSAKAQSRYLDQVMDKLTPEEQAIMLRARNHKNRHKPKNTDIITYKYATGLEAVIGYLYLTDQEKRIKTIMSLILEE